MNSSETRKLLNVKMFNVKEENFSNVKNA